MNIHYLQWLHDRKFAPPAIAATPFLGPFIGGALIAGAVIYSRRSKEPTFAEQITPYVQLASLALTIYKVIQDDNSSKPKSRRWRPTIPPLSDAAGRLI